MIVLELNRSIDLISWFVWGELGYGKLAAIHETQTGCSFGMASICEMRLGLVISSGTDNQILSLVNEFEPTPSVPREVRRVRVD